MLEVQELSKHYGNLIAVDSLSFRLEEGEFVTLLGPSGCGKSTTLHAIAGLIKPTEGRILLRGEDVTDDPPEDRNIGMTFQNTALFPHMTVRENIAYGLRMHGYGQDAIDDRVDESLELVDMPEHGHHKPDELSGGQQQRVSLARALAYEPDILLLDEPLTGLDRVLREEMRGWLQRIQREVGVTSLYVTHDQEDALSMSDRVIVLNDGVAEQIDEPERIYEEPANDFVAEFVGKSTKFEGSVTDKQDGRAVVQNESKPITIDGDHPEGAELTLYVRPEDIEVDPGTAAENEINAFVGNIVEIANLGDRAEVNVSLEDGTSALVHVERFPNLSVGDTVTVRFNPESVIAI